jgi:methylmalonyl-CoA carboxyltransferase large subunit
VRIDATANGTKETTMTQPYSESMDLRATLNEILGQLARLSERVAGLEELASMGGAESAPSPELPSKVSGQLPEAPPATSSVAASAGISEQELLAISAALAAWLGVHAHIRQIRLIRTGAWAQQGRVTIQTSHRLNY